MAVQYPTREAFVAAFWSKVAKSPDGCWEWLGLKHDGYGRTSGRRWFSSKIAHRIAYELLVGPIPNGKQIDHLCRNRACVNPSHLEPVDPQTNTTSERCGNCGRQLREHISANYSDGQMVSGEVLVCPTGVFAERAVKAQPIRSPYDLQEVGKRLARKAGPR